MKKAISGIALLAVLSSLIVFPNTAFADPGRRDLLVDGSMDSPDMAAWRAWGKVSDGVVMQKELNEENNYEGNRLVHMLTPNIHIGIQQVNIPVRAGGMYKLRMHYKVQTGKLMVLAGIRSSNSDFERRPDILVPTDPQLEGGWWDYTRVIKIPDNFPGDFRLALTLFDGEAFIDDVQLEDYTEYVFESNDHDYDYLVRDPYMFMKGRAHWLPYAWPQVLAKKNRPELAEDWYDSVLYINSLGTNSGVQQMNVPVQASRKYRLRFSYRLTQGALQPLLGLRTSNRDFQNVSARLRATGNEWGFYERDFAIPANFVNDFRIVLIIRNGEAYIDNMTLQDITDPFVTKAGTLRVGYGDGADNEPLRVGFGEEGAHLGSVQLQAAGEDILIQDLTLDIATVYENGWENFYNFRLYDGENEVARESIIAWDDFYARLKITFQDMALTVRQNAPLTLRLEADIVNEADAVGVEPGRIYFLSVTPAIDGRSIPVVATGVHTGVPIKKANLQYYQAGLNEFMVERIGEPEQSLTVTADRGFDNQVIVAGGASARLGSFRLEADDRGSLTIQSMSVRLTADNGGALWNYTNLKLCRSDTACIGVGNQFGTTIATAAEEGNEFTLRDVIIPSGENLTVDVHATIAPTTIGRITVEVPRLGVAALAENGQPILAPEDDLHLATSIVVNAGRLKVTTELVPQPSGIIHANELGVPLAIFTVTPEFEPIMMDRLSVFFTNGVFNLNRVFLNNFETGEEIASAAVVSDGVTRTHQAAVFGGFQEVAQLGRSTTYSITANTTPPGVMSSQSTVNAVISYMRATGVNSGQVIMPGVAGVEVGTASAISVMEYLVGDLLFYDDASDIASSGLVVERASRDRILAVPDDSAPFTSGIMLNDSDGPTAFVQQGKYISKFDKNSYVFERASPRAENAYNVGDLVYFVDYSAAHGYFATVTQGIAVGETFATLGLAGGGINSADGQANNGMGRASEIAPGEVDIAGDDADFIARMTNTAAVNPQNAENLLPGDVAFLHDSSAHATYPFIAVDTEGDFDLTNNTGSGIFAGDGFYESGDDDAGSVTIDTGDHITKLNKISNETVNQESRAAFEYMPGDIVFLFDADGAAAGTYRNGFYVVATPVRKGELLSGVSLAPDFSLAPGDIITKISSPTRGPGFKANTGELKAKVAAESPAPDSFLSIDQNVPLGVLKVSATGNPLYLDKIVVQKVGSGEYHLEGLDADTQNLMRVMVNGTPRPHVQTGENCTLGCWVSRKDFPLDNDDRYDDSYVIDFLDPILLEPDGPETLITFELTTFASLGQWAPGETLGLRIGGAATAGMASSQGFSVFWDPIPGDGGITPTPVAPVTEINGYPIEFAILRHF